MNLKKILLVDDDLQALDSARKLLELSSYEVTTANNGQEALAQVRLKQEFDVVLTDVRMPHLGGVEFLRALTLCGDKTPVVLMTAYGCVEDAVWAMKLGAVDFLTKPFKKQVLLQAIEVACKRKQYQQSINEVESHSLLIGQSKAIQELRQMIRQVASTTATALIVGESGTGKELVARSIHEKSLRNKKPFIALNCAAFPEQLIESELFGFEKGAFTGANQAKEGLFEAAHGGTLLLDEIGDMPFSLQAKLLRLLQEGEVRRIGSSFSRKVDVRVIAATHQNLRQNIQAGSFRQDLLYRLEVITLQVPPLREGLEDIQELAYHFLKQACQRHGKSIAGISEEVMEALLSHLWPGNVRELSNVIERAVVFSEKSCLSLDDLPPHLLALSEQKQPISNPSHESTISIPLGTPLKEVEEILIRKTLKATDGDRNMTAKLLGIHSRTIYRKLDKHST